MRFFLFILFIGGVLFTLTQLPVVTGRGMKEVKNALARTETIELSGKTLFISDLHLTAQPALDKQFNLDFSDLENVVIVGDFFNTPEDFAKFGKSHEESLMHVFEQLISDSFSGRIFFISNANAHDTSLKLSHLSFDTFDFTYLGEYGKFTIDGTPALAFHGQQLYGGIFGGGISWLSQKLGNPLPLERLGRKRFGINKDTWIVTGHSHVPAIHYESKTANTGSFAGVPFNFFFRIHKGTGILFEDEEVRLVEF